MIMPTLGGNATKIILVLLLISIISVICVISLPVFEQTNSACRDLDDCDPFLPVCATYANEHQFFYSQCDLLRESCLTGKDWKSDYFDHCNVSNL